MRAVASLIVLAVGFAVMLASYLLGQRVRQPTPWTSACLFVGRAEPAAAAGSLPRLEAPMRLLPLSARAGALARLRNGDTPSVGRALLLECRENVLLVAGLDAALMPESLASGRMPAPGKDEVLAGFAVGEREQVPIAGRVFRVVGRLRREEALFYKSYLLPDHPVHGALFGPEDMDVHRAYLYRGTDLPAGDATRSKALRTAFPSDRFAVLAARVPVERAPFLASLVGLALLLLGGTGLFVRLYDGLAGRLRSRFLLPPLEAIREWRRLFVALHLSYFGAVVLAMAFVYALPEVQSLLLSATRAQIEGGEGPLGLAGKAYASRSILVAAAATFIINLLVGALASLTIPSVLVPGVGVLAALSRACLWGALLAPSDLALSRAMLPHAFTVLLEGEGYILATFFALLVPLKLFGGDRGMSWTRRYGRALLLNVRGTGLVAAVLAVAALYEAVEVLHLAR